MQFSFRNRFIFITSNLKTTCHLNAFFSINLCHMIQNHLILVNAPICHFYWTKHSIEEKWHSHGYKYDHSGLCMPLPGCTRRTRATATAEALYEEKHTCSYEYVKQNKAKFILNGKVWDSRLNMCTVIKMQYFKIINVYNFLMYHMYNANS